MFRNIEDYENLYVIDIDGNVKSLPVNGTGIGKGKSRKEIILKQHFSHNKHLYVKLCKNGKSKHYFVQVLVAKAFPEICGEWFEGCEVHHKDLDPLNNNAYNLVVLSKEEHLQIHKDSLVTKERRSVSRLGKSFTEEHRRNLSKAKKGKVNPKRKPVLQYDLEGNFIKEWVSISEAAKLYGRHIADVCLGKRKSCYNYIWKYKN